MKHLITLGVVAFAVTSMGCGDDSPTTLDSGSDSDAGAGTDAGTDGGGGTDSGTDAGGTDTGAGLDSGPMVDAGPTTCSHTLADLQGGWDSRGLFVCFSGTDTWIGDSRGKLDDPAKCQAAANGCTLACDGGTPGTTFDAKIVLADGSLTLEVQDCSGDPAECVATYTMDATVICE